MLSSSAKIRNALIPTLGRINDTRGRRTDGINAPDM